MSEHERQEDEQGPFAAGGRGSHESEDTISPDELGTEDRPVPPPSQPKQPTATPMTARGGGLWARLRSKLKRSG